jgi:hypothetical protein
VKTRTELGALVATGALVAAAAWIRLRALQVSPYPPPPPMVGQPGAVWVPADRPEPVWLNFPLTAGQWYVVEAWGVFSCWPNHNDGVDPYYGYGPWYFGAQPQPWAQLLVDDRPM